MRKITEKAAAAFKLGHTFNESNTNVATHHKSVKMYLHGNLIAYRENGRTFIQNCGWFSDVTKERLNAIDGVSIYQKKGVWYLNGKTWDGKPIEIKTTSESEKKMIDFVKVSRDINGNPRYVCHMFNFITDKDSENAKGWNRLDDLYALALKRAKQLGGRKFHNKQYGGGIVFQSYNIEELGKQIQEMMQNLIKVRFFMETGNGTDSATPFAVWGTIDSKTWMYTGYAHIGQHTTIHPDYIADKKPAKPKQYKDLKRELESLGYYVEVE